MIYIKFAMGLFLLAFGGNIMVSGAVSLARRMGVSALLIGLTLVGFGTSTPELVTSLLAAFEKSDGIAVGNVVGSNIANILLVLGAAAVIHPVAIDVKSFRRDSLFLILSTAGLILTALFGQINRFSGALLVGVLIYYVIYSYRSEKQQTGNLASHEKTDEPVLKPLVKTISGIALTLVGAKLLVDSAIVLARFWGVSEAIIGLTIVAVGTSLPELATSVIASARRQNDVAFGNVVGSNIYNALFILGLTAFFIPVTIQPQMMRDIALMSVVTALLVGFAFIKRQISRRTGGLFLALYALYIFYCYGMESLL